MKQMGLDERIEIYMLLGKGYTQKEITKKTGYSQGAISKEIKKGMIEGKYNVTHAQNTTKALRKNANKMCTNLLYSNHLFDEAVCIDCRARFLTVPFVIDIRYHMRKHQKRFPTYCRSNVG